MTEKLVDGVEVPTPTFPFASTIKLVPDVEPTVSATCPGNPAIENIPYGVLVPTPILGSPPVEPTENNGGGEEVIPGVEEPVDVPILHALNTFDAIVLVAEF